MSNHAIIYTTPDCPRCSHAKNVLDALGYTIESRDVDALVRGDFADSEAMTELTMNDGALPVVVEVDEDAEVFNKEEPDGSPQDF